MGDTDDHVSQLYKQSLKGKNLDPFEALAIGLVGRLTGAAEQIAPYGSRASDWISEQGEDYGLTKSERITMYKNMDRLLRVEPMYLNAHLQFLTHIFGDTTGIGLVKLNGREHPYAKRLRKLFPNFPSLARFIGSNLLKYGELYAVHFPVTLEAPLGHPKFELFAPDRCQKIHCENEAALLKNPRAFSFSTLRKAVNIEGYGAGIIPASCVTHFRIHYDLNDGLHGMSTYYVAAKELTRYVDWLESRGLRARANAIFLIIRSLRGASSGEWHEVPDRPMIVDANADRETFTPLEAGGSARDAGADGYEFRVRAQQGLGLAEPDVSGDPTYMAQVNRSYSTLLYRWYQREIGALLIEFAAKTLGLDDPGELYIDWPFVDPSERSAQFAEVSGLAQARIISRAEAHRRLGYNHRVNEAELEAELKEEVAQTAPAGVPTIQPNLPGGEMPRNHGIARGDVRDPSAEPERIDLGVDYGYAGNGAIVLAGEVPGGFAALGEIKLHRAPLDGDASWRSTLAELKDSYPIGTVYVGSDAPEIRDLLDELGFDVVGMKLAQEDSVKHIAEYKNSGKGITISPRCKRLIGELFPEDGDATAGKHLRAHWDFWDAFRYVASSAIGAGVE